MSYLHGPGWIHEDDESGEPCGSPQEALTCYLMNYRGSCDDDSDERTIAELDGTDHAVLLMERKTLESEQMRDDEMAGIDDEESLIELPIGGTFFKEMKRFRYAVEVKQTGDEESGNITITYKRKRKTSTP